MNQGLINKKIILGITGGIAAYKSADLARRLVEVGADVRVIMSQNAATFITPLTMQAVSGSKVYSDMFDAEVDGGMDHIALARWADAILIAPATANIIAKLAQGEATDLLSTVCLATRAPIAVAPAMNGLMWSHPFTQKNVKILADFGMHILGPGIGEQACGEKGPGRMLEPLELVANLTQIFAPKILNQSVLITAGPTREAIDPIRYMSNASSGKMGYALAIAARDAGATVTLVSGPVHLPKPVGINIIDVVNTQDMYDAVMANAHSIDIFIGVAAVADYRPIEVATQKIPKTAETMQLTLVRNPDIAASVSALEHRPYMVGFAAETEHLIQNATAKKKRKNLDMVIANQVGQNLGFDQDENSAIVLWNNQQKVYDKMSKQKLARELIVLIAKEVTTYARQADSNADRNECFGSKTANANST